MEMYKNMKVCVLMAVLLLVTTIQIIPLAMATGRQKMWVENYGKFSDDVCVPKRERCGPKQDGKRASSLQMQLRLLWSLLCIDGPI